MDFWITQLKLFLINIATPHEFGLPCEKNALPPHSFAHCFSESSFECVSCRNITSAFLFRHQVNIVLHHISPHSFRRGGATFAFEAKVPSELIKAQGDWRSDCYLIYLEMTDRQKRAAATRMAAAISHIAV